MSSVARFRAGLRGELLRPDAAAYYGAHRVFNATIIRRPALIPRGAGMADVRRGVKFAATHALPLSIRGGGHGVAGNAVRDGGLMLDPRRMKGRRVDPTRRIGQDERAC